MKPTLPGGRFAKSSGAVFSSQAAAVVLLTGLAIAAATLAQQPDIKIDITGKRGLVRIAVPEIRGQGVHPEANRAFNDTLWNDLESSGVLEMVSKSFYPTEVPQKPEDFKPPLTPTP